MVPLDAYRPLSMLRVRETRVERPRFPVIDIHAHLSWSGRRRDGTEDAEAVTYIGRPSSLLPVMDRKDVRVLVNLTGGCGRGLSRTVDRFDRSHPQRFLTFTEPWWSRATEPGYPAFQAEQIRAAHAAGARGLKVLKTLGLYLRDGGPRGRLVPVDDRRFDPMWETCAALRLPVGIHVADPVAFFRPIDASTSGSRSCITIPIGRSTAATFPASRRCSVHAIACSRVIRRRRGSRITWATRPRISRPSVACSIGFPT